LKKKCDNFTKELENGFYNETQAQSLLLEVIQWKLCDELNENQIEQQQIHSNLDDVTSFINYLRRPVVYGQRLDVSNVEAEKAISRIEAVEEGPTVEVEEGLAYDMNMPHQIYTEQQQIYTEQQHIQDNLVDVDSIRNYLLQSVSDGQRLQEAKQLENNEESVLMSKIDINLMKAPTEEILDDNYNRRRIVSDDNLITQVLSVQEEEKEL